MTDMNKVVWHSEFNEEWNLAIKERIEGLNSRIKELDRQNNEMRKKIGDTLAEMDIMAVRGKADTDEYCDLNNTMVHLTTAYNDYKARYTATRQSLKDAILNYEYIAESMNALQQY
jgi:chromosome segregation ATPase